MLNNIMNSNSKYMKKSILRLFLVLILALGLGQAWGQTTIWSDGFEANSWTTAGNFFRNTQNGNPGNPVARTGSRLLGTARNGAYANNLTETGNYAQNSTAISCSGYNTTTLRFWSFSNFENNWDYGYVYVSGNNGSNYTLVETFSATETGWTEHIIDISSIADNQSQVIVRFTMSSDGNTTQTGWNIDDISITGTLDVTAPTVSSVSSSTANGTYNIGDVIAVTVQFNENVTVTGIPQIILETGATDRTVNYSSGSGTNTLTFNYTVQSGDVSADLDYVATTSLALNSGTIRDAAANNATLTLAAPGAANSLGANRALVIDGVLPTVTSVSSSTANETYNIGDVIAVTVQFNENVTVTGTPQITLETGTTDRIVNYSSGSGTNTLIFNYTVQSGDVSADLDYVNTTSLALNSGTIRDAATNNATLTLAAPGASNSLGANKALVVDGVLPTVSNYNPLDNSTDVGANDNLVITFSENVIVGTAGNIIIYNSGGTVFETIPYNDTRIAISSNTVTINPTGTFVAGASYYINIGSSAISDNAGNTFAGISDATTWNFSSIAYYRSIASTAWNLSTTWETSTDGISWPGTAAVVTPNATNSAGILIQSSHSVTVTADVTADDLTVDGTLNVNTGITLTVANGAASTDMTVSSTGIINNTGTITPTGIVAINGTYNHTRNGGAIPTAAWDQASNCNVTGITNTALTGGMNQTFGNFTWNCSGQSGIVDLTSGAISVVVDGNFYVQNTNSQTLGFTNSDANTNLQVNGNLTVGNGTNASVFNLKRNNNNNTNNIYIGGNLTVATSSTLTKTGTGTSATINLGFTGATASSNVNLSGSGTFTNTYINYVVQNVPTGKTVNLQTNLAIPTGRSFTVNAGSVLYCNPTSVISGAGTFTLGDGTNGATLGIAHANGINGNITTTTRNFNGASTGATFIYNSSVASQVTGTNLPGTVSNLTINNTFGGGTVSLSQNTVVGNQLTLTSGGFPVGNFTLSLNGPAIAGTPANLSTTSSSSLLFGGSSTGINIPSSVTSLNNLTLNNTATNSQITMNSNITLAGGGVLTLTSGDLVTGSFYIAVTNTATSSITGNSSVSYIYGNLRRTLLANIVANGTTYVFPVGESSDYKPFELVNIRSGATSPVVAVSVSSLPAATTSDGTSITTMFPRNWYANVVSGNFTSAFVRLTETTTAENTIGICNTPAGSPLPAGPYTLLGGVGGAATIISPAAVLNASLPAFFALGKPIVKTYYSYQNGNWNNANSWTLDPSGTTWVNPSNSFPGVGDDTYILNGRTITATANVDAKQLSVEFGGVLDLSAFTSHDFVTVLGDGLIRINSLTFPAGDFSGFVASGGGTIEYYNVGGSLPSQSTYNNLSITKTDNNTSNYNCVLQNDLIMNGNLLINRTQGSGTITLTIGNNTTARTVTVFGNISVSAGARLYTGATASMVNHIIYIYGDLLNNGTVRFTNQASPVTDAYYTADANTGTTWAIFKGNTNNTVTCNGITDFYRLIVDKGIDQTYVLEVSASSSDNFALYGRNDQGGNQFDGGVNMATAWYYGYSLTQLSNLYSIHTEAGSGVGYGLYYKALYIANGTLKLNTNVNLPSITEGGQDFNLVPNASLWANGGVVSTTLVGVNGTGYQAATLYGKVRVSAGSFSTGDAAGIVLGSLGTPVIQVEGTGTFDASQIWMNGSNTVSYIQTGGTTNIRAQGEFHNGNMMNLSATSAVFIMSGGTLNFLNDVSDGTQGLVIGSSSGNYEVTGGSVNIRLPNGETFDISSTAPFYNLNVLNTTGSGSVVARLLNPPTSFSVLNDINLGSYTTLNALTNQVNLNVGGDFILNANSTYSPGTNATITTTFNGSSGQEFQINGTITGGLNNFTLSNTTATVLTGSNNLTVNRTLTINELCALEDGGKTITTLSTVYNAGTHSSNLASGVGRIVLAGTANQAIQGNGNGVFGNLQLNNANGATFSANQIVRNTLTLTSGILDIGIFRLSLYNNTTAAVSGTFSATRMIRTSGNQSDGGILKVFTNSPNNTFTYPIGTGTVYTPATITATATTYGNVIVRPVSKEQPFAIGTTNKLQRYWKVESEYFIGVSNVTSNYTYPNAEVQGDETQYYAAVYTPYIWTKNNNSGIPFYCDFTNNRIYFTTSQIDGEYTAGLTGAFPSSVTVFYSKKSGNWVDTDPATNPWSNLSNSGTDNLTTSPGADNPVVIGNGSGLNHTITVNSNTQSAGSLVLNDGSVLDLGITTGHNFGALPNQQVGGSGTLRISRGGSAGTAEFPAGDFGAFIGNAGGTVEYYTSGFNLTVPSVSNNVPALNLTTYSSLNLMASANTVTMPNINLTVYDDLTVGGASYTGISRLNSASVTALNVNDSVIINGGNLQYQNGFAHALIVGGDLVISSTYSASLSVLNGGTAVANTLSIAGNLSNNGTLLLLNGGRYCNLTFTGNNDKSFTGTNSGASTNLNLLTINKGSNQNSILTMDVLGTLTTLTNNWLTISNGTFRFAAPSRTITLTDAAATNFIIPSTACLSINNPTSTIIIGSRADNACDLLLNGKLEVRSGTINIGRSVMTDNNNNDIEYASAGSPEINIQTGGILNVNGQIRYNTNNTLGSLIYNQSGGDVTIWGHNNEPTRAKLAVHNTGSVFNMSNGTLTIKTDGGTTFSDLYIRPELSTVSGGTILFNATSVGNQTFNLDANVPIFNLSLVGAASNTTTLNLVVNPLEMLGSINIDANSTFIANNLDVSIGANFTKSGTYTHGANTTLFNGAINQDITCNNATTFNNLTVSKNSGVLSLAGTIDPSVIGTFSLSNGTFDTKGRNLFVIGNIHNSGTHISSGVGAIVVNGAVKQYISGNGNGSFANLTLNNIDGIELSNAISISKQLNFQNGMFYINNNLLTFTETAPIPSGAASDKFISTNGVTSDEGIRKIFAIGNSTFTLPVGSLASGINKYTPVTYTLTGVAGVNPYIQVRPVNSKHLATTDPLNLELTYYWNVTASSTFAATGLTQVYSYLQNDVPVTGTESSFLGGRLPFGNTIWEHDGTVDYASNNTITFTNTSNITGDYTAGEIGEFGTIKTYYSRNATLGGNWTDASSWSTIGHGGASDGTYPQGNPVVIANGHIITSTTNGCSSINLNILGTMDLRTTTSHNFITTGGNGRLRIEANGAGAFVIPGGNLLPFINTNGSTIEYNSTGGVTISPLLTTYQNLELSGNGNKSLANVDLVVLGNLTVALSGTGQFTNAGFNRNITIYKDWLNNSTLPYIPGLGTVTFSGSSSAQMIGGSGSIPNPGETFYRVVIANPSGLNLNRNINIKNDLVINSGAIFSGGANTINIQGNWINNSNNRFNAGTSTVNFNGTSAQNFYGLSGESFNNLTVGNSTGLTASCNSDISGNIDFTTTIDTRKLMIGSYSLNLTSTTGIVLNAGSGKFIQTNGLAGDAGVTKNVISPYNFNFPVGVGTKYTPASFNETGSGGGSGIISIKPVNSKHPYANNNITDELQFYWIVNTYGSLTPVTVSHAYTFISSDALPNTTGYVSGRFYNNDWTPVLGGESNTSVGAATITFTNKNYLNGEYTCGIPSNFGVIYTYYSRDNAPLISSGADWRNLSTWSTLGHDDNINIPNRLPNANSVIIKAGHNIVCYDNGINLSSLTLNGNLQLNTTSEHNFGSVLGTGKLSVKNDVSNQFVLPVANLSIFTSSTGGTIEYEGVGNLPEQSSYNDLILLGSGIKNLPAQNIGINGDLTIQQGQLNNINNINIDLKGNWINNQLTSGFIPHNGLVSFSGTVPQTILVPNTIESFDDLTIASGSNVSIIPGAKITVNSDIINNGTLILQSPAGNGATASLINYGTITGTGTAQVQRYIVSKQSHYLTSPIQTPDIDPSSNAWSTLFTSFGGGYNANFYSYNEAVDLDGNPSTSPQPYSPDNLAPGWVFEQRYSYTTPKRMVLKKGYSFYGDISGLRTFIGKLNTGDMSVSGLTYNGNDPTTGPLPDLYDGWNLVGNPYPSAIDWDAMSGGFNNMDNAVYVWNGATGSYGAYIAGSGGIGTNGQTNIIASMQGFFVHSTANGAGFTLNNLHRVHSATTTFKSSRIKSAPADLIKLKVLTSTGKSDETVVYFKANATGEHDAKLDALAKFSWNTKSYPNYYNYEDIPNLYSVTNSSKIPMAINALPDTNKNNLVVPLGLRLGTSGNVTISKASLNISNTNVYLIDKVLNKSIYLNVENSYSFSFTKGDVKDRFELRFRANNAPAANNIDNKAYSENEVFSFTIPANAFVESDEGDQILRYSATLYNGEALPEWLIFNPNTLSFNGKPGFTDAGELLVKVNAYDIPGACGTSSFKLLISNVNNTPVRTSSIPDQEVNELDDYLYQIPSNIFYDMDIDDELFYSVKMSDGSSIPSWLSFSSQNNTLYGVAQNPGNLNITVTATDRYGSSVSDIFVLSVKSSTGIDELNNLMIKIYPNPTDGKFTFNVGAIKPDMKVYIRDIYGKLVIAQQIKDIATDFDISTFSNGIYSIELRNGEESKVYKLILQK
jgi:hypothetical protein